MEQRYRSITHRGHAITLVDVTNAHISPTSLAVAKGDAKQVQSFIKATAVVGSGSVVDMMVRAVSRFSGMRIGTFATRDEAMEHLAGELSKR